jgi:hypothetical protein
MIYYMMINEHRPLNERHLDATAIARSRENFEFTTISGKPLSEQSANFLKSTLEMNTNLRLNW